MDLDQLMAFERIVREGSFSRAARSLDIAQPTISARIQALEEAVGGPLFLRGGRVIALTERGQSFLPYAQHAISVLAEGVETARLTQSGERGRVTVAAIPSLAGSFLAATIVRFHRTHPQVDLLVKVGNSKQIMAQLADGIVTLGLISWPYFNPDVQPLLRFREALKLMVSASHALAGRESVTLEEVQRAGVPIFEVKLWVSIDPALAQLTAQTQPIGGCTARYGASFAAARPGSGAAHPAAGGRGTGRRAHCGADHQRRPAQFPRQRPGSPGAWRHVVGSGACLR